MCVCVYAASVPRIKARRCFKVETMCNFNEEEEEEEDKPIKVSPQISNDLYPLQAGN